MVTAARGRWQSWGALDKRVWQMAFARAVNTMGLSLVMSFLGIYIVETRGYPAWVYGIIALVSNAGQSLTSAWAGNLSDRIGRKPVIVTTLYVRSVVIAALGTLVVLDAPLWSLSVAMIAASALRGCFEPVAYALVSDVCGNEQRIAAFGLQRIGTNIGWAVGPTLGGVLTLIVPYGVVFYFAAAGMIVAAVVAMQVVDPRPDAKQRAPAERGVLRAALREGMRDPLMSMILWGTLLCALLETQMFSTFAIYMTDELHFHKADVGLLYSINGAGALLLQVPALVLIRRLGINRILPWSSLLDAAAFALIGVGTSFGGAALAFFALTCAEVVFDPAHQAAIAESADPTRAGRAFGIVSFVQMIGIAGAPLIGGLLFDIIGSHHLAMWGAIALFGVGQTACFTVYVRRRRARTGKIAGARAAA